MMVVFYFIEELLLVYGQYLLFVLPESTSLQTALICKAFCNKHKVY